MKDLVLDLVYDVDESLTLKSKRQASKVELRFGIAVLDQHMVIATIIMVLILGSLLPSVLLANHETKSVSEMYGTVLYPWLAVAFVILGERVLSPIYQAMHRRVDPKMADAEKSHGDGYQAWAYLSLGIFLTGLTVILLPWQEYVPGWLFAGYLYNSAYRQFITRQGTNKPRKRRKLRQKAAETIRERLAGRQVLPQPM